ncbi:hypothetical protein SGLAM104S_10367 [Streptomyces glaucescens]
MDGALRPHDRLRHRRLRPHPDRCRPLPVVHARLAAGIARVPDLLAAGVPVGLGVHGTASNESGELHTELRNALLINRLGVHREAA